MQILVITLLLMIPSFAHPDTIRAHDLVGCWTRVVGVAFGDGSQTVCIDGNFHSKWITNDGKKTTTKETTLAKFVDEFAILSTEDESLKIVVSGWIHANGDAALFGTIYLYGDLGEEDGLFNGLFFILRKDKSARAT